MLEIDGAHGEGGGQLLRMAMALAAVRGTPIRIVRIRAGRPNPGLAPQHVAAVRAVAELCSAEVDGLETGASQIVFRPGTIVGGERAFDVGTAGSVTLVLQACLPVAFLARQAVRLHVTGGTDVRWAPPLDYFSRVFLPWIRRLGGAADLVLHRRGYYPRGGGSVELVTHPVAAWSGLQVQEAGKLRRVRGIAHVANLPEDIPKRIRHAAIRRLHGVEDVKIEERVYRGEEAVGQGGALVLWAETEYSLLGADSLAERGKSSERVGEDAAAALSEECAAGAAVDIHAADQILPYLALAQGLSSFTVREVTGHLRSMAWLIGQVLGRNVEFQSVGSVWRVKVEGSRP